MEILLINGGNHALQDVEGEVAVQSAIRRGQTNVVAVFRKWLTVRRFGSPPDQECPDPSHCHECTNCHQTMESPVWMGGQLDMCPACASYNLVPIAFLPEIAEPIIHSNPPSFRPLYVLLVEASSAFHNMLVVSSAMQLVKRQEEGITLRFGRGTLFEVRLYFLHGLGEALSMLDHDRGTRNALLWFCGDLICAEFLDIVEREAALEIIGDRYDRYTDCQKFMAENPGTQLKELARFINWASHHTPARSNSTPYVITGLSNFELQISMAAAESIVTRLFWASASGLFRATSDISTLAPDEVQALLDKGARAAG